MIRLELAGSAALAAQLAADIIADSARKAIAARGRAAIALSGGTTPKLMFERLAAAALPWNGIHLFQVDERVVAPDDPARNLMSIRAAFEQCMPAAIYPMPADAADHARAARSYAELMRSVLGADMAFDVVHLGLGADGHTASLVPGDAALESNEAVSMTAPYLGRRRMTMTFSILNLAHLRVWLVTGRSKRDALQGLLDGDTALVASRIKRDDSIVVADAEAAGRSSAQSE